jgi:hypothetical protein
MHQILDQLLEASSERDMQRPFEEFSGEVEENASAALEGLSGGLFDATAMVALPREVSTPSSDNEHAGVAPPKAFGADAPRRSSASFRTPTPSVDSLEHCVPQLTKSGVPADGP